MYKYILVLLIIAVNSEIYAAMEFYNDKSDKIDTLDFGDICFGETNEATLFIKNVSGSAIDISGSVFQKGDVFFKKWYSFDNLLNNQFESFSITFNPHSPGTFVDKLYFYKKGSPYPVDSVMLKGSIVKTQIGFNDDAFFIRVKMHTRDTVDIYLINYGKIDARIESISKAHKPFKRIGVEPKPPVTLKPGDSIKVKIEYAPDEIGERALVIDAHAIRHNNACPTDAQTWMLGTCLFSFFSYSKEILDFGNVPNCQTRLDTTYLKNIGDIHVDINRKAEIAGANSECFEIIEQPVIPYRVEIGDSVRYIIKYTPKEDFDTPKNAQLKSYSSHPKEPVTLLTLKGRSESFKALVSPVVDHGTIQPKVKHDTTVMLYNNGSFPLFVNRIESGSPEIEALNISKIIPPSDSLEIPVNLTLNYLQEYVGSARLIFTEPCLDTLNITVRGRALISGAFVTPEIDFGKVPYCEVRNDSILIKNTGDNEIEVLEISLNNLNDAKYYINSPQTPIMLMKKDSLWVKTGWKKSSGMPTGLNRAEVLTKIRIEKKEPEFKTVIISDLKTLNIEYSEYFDFGDVAAGKDERITSIITNRTGIPVTLNSISAPANSNIFAVSYDKPPIY